MKKYIGIVFALVCILSLTACGNEKEIELLLPEVENITEIELLENTSEVSNKITDKEEIAKLISEIKEHSKPTKKQSVNDQPTNVDYYIIMKFYYHNAEAEQSQGYLYLYQEKQNSYIEQPYSGIWELENEVFSSISETIWKK